MYGVNNTTTTPPQEAAAGGGGGGGVVNEDALHKNHEIFATAMGRWLNVSELETLLTPSVTPLTISTHKPLTPPPSGTLILYDRSVTRNYKDDGYEWVKKRNSHKVREDHVKLRVGGRFRVAGCYVHCVTNATLHRRAYHLLDPETGTALNPPGGGGGGGGNGRDLQRRVSSESVGSDGVGSNKDGSKQNSSASLILVHYLDTQVAALHSAKLAAEGPRSDTGSDSGGGSRRGGGGGGRRRRSKSPGVRSRGSRKNKNSTTSSVAASALAAAAEAQKQQQAQLEQQQRMQQLLLQKQHVGAAIAQMQAAGTTQMTSTADSSAAAVAQQEQLRMLQEKLKQEEAALAADVASASLQATASMNLTSATPPASSTPQMSAKAGGSQKFDDDTLGILWGMVMEEGGDSDLENLFDGSGGADALTSMLGGIGENDMSSGGGLETLDESSAVGGTETESTLTTGEEGGGMSAVAASAMSAFEQEIYEAAKMTLHKGKSPAHNTEIAAELAAAVEAAVEPQLTQQDLSTLSATNSQSPFATPQPTSSPYPNLPLPPPHQNSILSVQQQLELLQHQRLELEKQQQLQLKAQQRQQEEEAQKLQQQLRQLQEVQLKQQREAQKMQQEQLAARQAEEQIRVERQSQELHQRLQKQLELQLNQRNTLTTASHPPMAPQSNPAMQQHIPPPINQFNSNSSDDVMETEPSETSTSGIENDRLLDIVDFTPEHALIHKSNHRKTKIVLSCSAPIPTLSDSNDSIFSWHTLVAFVNVGSTTNTTTTTTTSGNGGNFNLDLPINAVDLSILRKLNPYTYRCTVPSSAKMPGERLLIVVAVRLYAGTDPLCQGVGAGVAIALQAAWRAACIYYRENKVVVGEEEVVGERLIFTRRVISSGPGVNANIQLLSQLSEDSFLFQDGSDVSSSSSAAALQSAASFLRPDVKNSIGTSVTSNNGKHDTLGGITSLVQNTNTASSPLNEGASLRQSRKRSAPFSSTATTTTSMDMATTAPSFSPGYNALGITTTSTATTTTTTPAPPPWGGGVGVTMNHLKQSQVVQDETMMEDMDRHCKIRFVEKSSDAANGVGGGKTPTPPTAPSPGASFDAQKTDGGGNESGGGLLFLDSTELKTMPNDKLDSVLDSLLVRLVENLVEISCSSVELQKELNSPDKGGFTLLHYASLYNLQSLIPTLISHGANLDSPTTTITRGRFTPLHLACVAGNEAVVELLVRSGCAVWVYDSFHYSPVDYAVRNGYTKIASWLKDTAGGGEDAARRMKKESDDDDDVMELEGGNAEMEIERSLAQNAFSNLSLKDKLALYLLLRKRKKDGGQIIHNGAGGSDATGTSNQDADTDKVVAFLDSAISESDMESLNMAMRLMNQEELDDLENPVDEDLRKWMLRRNYESLKEATLYVQHTKNERSNIQQQQQQQRGGGGTDEILVRSSRGLQNVKNQAIAGLIIRKNMSRLCNDDDPLAPS